MEAAADEGKVPLIVGEGSIDAAAWNYPTIFEEQAYILRKSIFIYGFLLYLPAINQPLQWQFTSDYSPLAAAEILVTMNRSINTKVLEFLNSLLLHPKVYLLCRSPRQAIRYMCCPLGDNAKEFTLAVRCGGFFSRDAKPYRAAIRNKNNFCIYNR